MQKQCEIVATYGLLHFKHWTFSNMLDNSVKYILMSFSSKKINKKELPPDLK